jgi:hypothetical protein
MLYQKLSNQLCHCDSEVSGGMLARINKLMRFFLGSRPRARRSSFTASAIAVGRALTTRQTPDQSLARLMRGARSEVTKFLVLQNNRLEIL